MGYHRFVATRTTARSWLPRMGAAMGLFVLACRPDAAEPQPAAASTSVAESESESESGESSGDSGNAPFAPDPAWDRWEIRADDYRVPEAETTYVCFGMSFSAAEARQIVAFAPVIDEPSVVHHMILSRSAEPLDTIEPCYPGPPASLMIWGWGLGGGPLVIPPEAGLPVSLEPTQVHYVLQIHYENPVGERDIVDASGIDLYTTTDLRTHHAGIFSLGDVQSIVIPPGEPNWPTAFWCGSESTSLLLEEPINVFGSWLHAHRLGRSLWTEHYRGNERLPDLGRQDPYDFGDQRFMPLDAVVEPGDELRTYCYFDSTEQTEPVHGGGGTNDEMCLNYLMYYPTQPWLGLCNDD